MDIGFGFFFQIEVDVFTVGRFRIYDVKGIGGRGGDFDFGTDR